MFFTISAILGGLMNRIRGGLWSSKKEVVEVVNGVEVKKIVREPLAGISGPLFAIVFACVCYVVTQDKLLSAAMGVGIFLGEKPSWGEEIGLIVHESKWLEGILALGLRGIKWTAPIALPVAFYYPITAVFIALSGGLMGAVYVLTSIVYRRIYGRNADKEWAASEVTWGFVMWGLIIFLLSIPFGSISMP